MVEVALLVNQLEDKFLISMETASIAEITLSLMELSETSSLNVLLPRVTYPLILGTSMEPVRLALLKLTLTKTTLLVSGQNALIVKSKMVKEDALHALITLMLMIPATFAFKTLAITSPNILTSTDLARPAMLSSILMPNPYTEAALQTPVAMVKITLSNGVTRRLAEPTLNQIIWMTAKPLELAFLTNATGTPKS